VGEFGNNPVDDDRLLRRHYELQDADGVGGTLWLWKENANDTNPQFFWGVYGPPFGRGTPQPKRIAYTGRAYPLALDGDLHSLTYSPANHGFRIEASGARRARCGDRAHATLVFVPAATRSGIGASGARVEVFARGGGSREVYVYPTRSSYRVFSGAARAPTCAGAARRRPSRRHPGARFTG
jgi:hypothetical protein